MAADGGFANAGAAIERTEEQDRNGTAVTGASDTTVTHGAARQQSDRAGDDAPRVGTDDGDGSAPLPAAPAPTPAVEKTAAAAAPRAAQPPPRPTASKGRVGRRPSVRCRPSFEAPDSSKVRPASEPAAGAETTAEGAKDGGGGRDEEGVISPGLPTAPLSGGGDDGDASMVEALTRGYNGCAGPPRRAEIETNRPPRRSRGASRRRRRSKRLGGSFSSSLSPSSQSSGATKPTTGPTSGASTDEGPGTISPPIDGTPGTVGTVDTDGPAAAPGTGHVTFAAVPRERSPPPPPGIRIGGSNEEGEGGRRNAGGRPGGQGQEMVHLAFCSRCQEYQSWRAPVKDAGCWRGRKQAAGSSGGGGSGSASTRRSCTECGDLYCNVSYYPAR